MCDLSPTIVWKPFDNAGPSDRMPFHAATMLDNDFVPDWDDVGGEEDGGQTADWTGSPLFGDAPDSPPGLDSTDSDLDEVLSFNTERNHAISVAFGDDDCTLYSPATPSLGWSPASTVTSAQPTPFRVDAEPIFDGRPGTLAGGSLPELPHLFPSDWQGPSLTTSLLGLKVIDYDGLPLLADVPPSSREPTPFPIQLPYSSSIRRRPQALESWVPDVLEPAISPNATHHYAAWGWGSVPPT